MSISNADRHDLHNALGELLGEREANTLMEHLPPVGWADVATKRDLDHLESQLRGDFRAEIAELRAEVRSDIAELRTTVSNQMLRQTLALVGILGTLTAVFTAIN